MSKKTITIIVVVVIIAILVFVFSGKSKAAETESTSAGSSKAASVTSKWDLTRGSWTLAEREAALDTITVRMGYLNPGGPWDNWPVPTVAESIEGPIYQVIMAWKGGKTYAFPIYSDWEKMLTELRANGVYQKLTELQPSIIKFSIPRK